jgi:hypothetical protein
MSEVDRLRNPGLYPALPIADKGPSRDGSRGPPRDEHPPPSTPPAERSRDSATPRPPKSLIDEYA